MAFKWKREIIEKLILSVQQYPCLYDVESVEYLDRVKKAQAFNDIVHKLSKSESTITLDEIKRKWRILRNQFMREQRLIKNSKKSGAGIDDIYVPKLWCFEHLSFLQSHINMRATIDNIKVKSEEYIMPDFSDEVSLIEEQTRKIMPGSSEKLLFIEEQPRKRKKDTINGFRNDLDDFKHILKQKWKHRKFSWLGNLVAAQMENVNQEDQQDAAWQVQCLMRKLVSNPSRTRNNSNSSSSKDI